MATAMINSICCKIKGMSNLSPTTALELYAVVPSTSLDSEYKEQLTLALDAALRAEPAPTDRITPQSLTSPQNYLTAKDWEALESSSISYWQMLQVVANRLRLLGIRSLKEDTKKWCTALLVHVGMDKSGQMPPYSMIYQMVQDLVQAHQTSPLVLSHVKTFTVFPEIPPPEFVTGAYPTEDPPVMKCPSSCSSMSQSGKQADC